jgi:hypothetical protein
MNISNQWNTEMCFPSLCNVARKAFGFLGNISQLREKIFAMQPLDMSSLRSFKDHTNCVLFISRLNSLFTNQINYFFEKVMKDPWNGNMSLISDDFHRAYSTEFMFSLKKMVKLFKYYEEMGFLKLNTYDV